MSAVTDLVDEVCAAATAIPGDVRQVVTAEVDRLAPLATATTRSDLIAAAVARLHGLDALEPLLADPSVDEVLVNEGGAIWVERDGRLEPAGRLAPGVVDVVVQRILGPTGRRLDRTNPIIDTRLPDGSRVCAAIPPVAVDGTAVAIRRHRPRTVPLESFAPAAVVDVVRQLVARRANVLVSGATSSGKTTLLAAALSATPPDERIVVIEDTAEIRLDEHHLVRLEARPATPDGVPAVTTADLVRAALRLRPDRLVTGEFRGDEALAVVQALNTGHDGSWATCHANSALDALERLATLVLHAAPTWPMGSIRAQVARSIDAVVHVRRGDGRRRVDHIIEPHPEPDLAPSTIVTGGEVVGRLERVR